MDKIPSAIRIQGISKIDRLEIENSASKDTVRFETQVMQGSKFGIEPVTVAVVLLSVEGLKILSTWLLKNRKHNHIEKHLEIEYADGTKRIEEFKFDFSSSTAPDQQVLRALKDLLDVDVTGLTPQS